MVVEIQRAAVCVVSEPIKKRFSIFGVAATHVHCEVNNLHFYLKLLESFASGSLWRIIGLKAMFMYYF